MLIDAGLVLFAGASLALIVVPGPDMIYVITRGIFQGRTVGLLAAWGACSGLLLHTALAAAGTPGRIAYARWVCYIVSGTRAREDFATAARVKEGHRGVFSQ